LVSACHTAPGTDSVSTAVLHAFQDRRIAGCVTWEDVRTASLPTGRPAGGASAATFSLALTSAKTHGPMASGQADIGLGRLGPVIGCSFARLERRGKKTRKVGCAGRDLVRKAPRGELSTPPKASAAWYRSAGLPGCRGQRPERKADQRRAVRSALICGSEPCMYTGDRGQRYKCLLLLLLSWLKTGFLRVYM
jgi:hypothetical protein